MSPEVRIDRITEAEAVAPVVDLLEGYLGWAAAEIVERLGLGAGERARLVAEHRARFLDEVPELVGPRGRLLVASVDGELRGVVGLVPAEPGACEVKRMFVHPGARGLGMGRALLEALLAEARRLGHRRARLETMPFMVEALGLYRSAGFGPAPPPPSSEASRSGVGDAVAHLALDLGA